MPDPTVLQHLINLGALCWLHRLPESR